MKSYKEVEIAVKAKNYKWFTKPYSLNLVWQRTSYNATNVFDDFLHICYVNEKNEPQIISIPATTKPGLKGSLLEPITVGGVRGTAIIEAGQYLKSWEFRDTFSEFSKYPYFRQVGKLNYYRDGNKDKVIDKVQRQVAKIFGTHFHRMSNNDTFGSGLVNNWSLGCMGSPEPHWEKILPIVRRSVKMYGNLFSAVILD